MKQVEDITYLRDTIGFEKLSEGLEEIALARLSHPSVTKRTGRAFIASGGQIGGESQTQEIE